MTLNLPRRASCEVDFQRSCAYLRWRFGTSCRGNNFGKH